MTHADAVAGAASKVEALLMVCGAIHEDARPHADPVTWQAAQRALEAAAAAVAGLKAREQR